MVEVAKSRKTLKRKRRATSPSRFGTTLEALLETGAPEGVLGLRPGIARRQKEEKLERGALRVLEGERKEKEELGRVRDVIGGWGMEGERALRKVAQRGGMVFYILYYGLVYSLSHSDHLVQCDGGKDGGDDDDDGERERKGKKRKGKRKRKGKLGPK